MPYFAATPVEPHEICDLCGQIGRITVRANHTQRKQGVPDIQVCEPCLGEYGTMDNLWTELRRRYIIDFYEYRKALAQGLRVEEKPTPELGKTEEIARVVNENGETQSMKYTFTFRWTVTECE